MTIFAETFDFYKRQTYSAILELAFGFAGMLIALLYFLIKDWRIINIVMVCIPSLIILLFFILYLE
jgi:vacuolar-type H+-ATPase subunit I/STV1